MASEPVSDSTRWSAIAQLHDGGPGHTWDWFIRRYRGYVAAVLRHVGLAPADAAAATEEFWSYLYRSRAVERADRNGRFRSFLSGVARNFAKIWRREQRALDGSGTADSHAAAIEPADLNTEVEVELWAAQILHLGLARLGQRHADDERALRWFYGLPDEVGGPSPPPVRATEIARRLGCTANAMHQALFRARTRLRANIEKEISTTVANSPDLRDEVLLLLGAVDRARPGLVEPTTTP